MTEKYIKPDRETVIAVLSGLTREQWDRDGDDLMREAFRGRFGAQADTLLALWPGRSEAEVKAEARTLAAAGPRFWPRVKVGSKTECWAWTGPALPFGHGTWDGPYGKTTAHRYAWALANAGMPALGVVIRHKCDNPICCNPNHLEPGSQEENVRDMIERGRATFTDALCRNGHDRTPDNTLIRADGTRRCKECSRAQQAERRKRYVPLRCLYCDHTANVYNLRRHIQRVHGETVGATELRARADRIEGGDDRG